MSTIIYTAEHDSAHQIQCIELLENFGTKELARVVWLIIKVFIFYTLNMLRCRCHKWVANGNLQGDGTVLLLTYQLKLSSKTSHNTMELLGVQCASMKAQQLQWDVDMHVRMNTRIHLQPCEHISGVLLLEKELCCQK